MLILQAYTLITSSFLSAVNNQILNLYGLLTVKICRVRLSKYFKV